MNTLDTRRYEMLVRVRDFGASQTDVFPASSKGGQAFAAVAAAILDLGQHAATQLSGLGSAREGASSKAAAREALRDALEAINRTARAIALDMPAVDDKFRLPRGGSDQLLVNAARAFAKDAAPLAKEFAEHGMPENFLADLQESISDFEEVSRDREVGKGIHVAARAAIEQAMEAGLNALLRLDAIVPNVLQQDTGRLAMWERARRVETRTSRNRSETDDGVQATTPSSPAGMPPGAVGA